MSGGEGEGVASSWSVHSGSLVRLPFPPGVRTTPCRHHLLQHLLLQTNESGSSPARHVAFHLPHATHLIPGAQVPSALTLMPSTAFRIGPLCVSPSIRIGVSHCPIGGLLRFCGDFWRWPAKASTMDLCVGHFRPLTHLLLGFFSSFPWCLAVGCLELDLVAPLARDPINPLHPMSWAEALPSRLGCTAGGFELAPSPVWPLGPCWISL